MTHRPITTALRRAEPVHGLVSVIIPAHNAGAWLAETIGSVTAQSYRDVEIIVVDDGSSDTTTQVDY